MELLECKGIYKNYGKKEVLPRHCFEDFCQIEFEGKKFSAPIGFDEYLKSLYGDYKEKKHRIGHKHFRAYWK